MLRLFLFFLCLFILYKLFTASGKNAKSKKSRFKVVYPPPQSPPSQSLVIDEMKRCPSCGTFNPKSHALEFHGEYFCNEECKSKRV